MGKRVAPVFKQNGKNCPAAFVLMFLLQINQRVWLEENTRASPNAVNASNRVLTGLRDLEIKNATWGEKVWGRWNYGAS